MTKSTFTTPVGRLVAAAIDEPSTKDHEGNPRLVKSGPNAGQPSPQWFASVAINKRDPAWPAFWAQIVNQCVADFPQYFPHGAGPLIAAGGPDPFGRAPQGTCSHPQFSFKVADGDGTDAKGKSNASKEGHAGHWIVRISSGYAPKCFHAGKYAPHEQIQQPGTIRRGYYVRVNGTMEGNGDTTKPAPYLNLSLVELSAYGPEIVTGPNAEDAFGGSTPALPAGATAAPQTPGVSYGAPAAPVAPAPYVPPTAPAPAPAAPVTPYPGYMQQPGAPAAPAAPQPPAPPLPPAVPSVPVHQMTPAANGASYEQMIAAGWTDAMLRQHGMMV